MIDGGLGRSRFGDRRTAVVQWRFWKVEKERRRAGAASDACCNTKHRSWLWIGRSYVWVNESRVPGRVASARPRLRYRQNLASLLVLRVYLPTEPVKSGLVGVLQIEPFGWQEIAEPSQDGTAPGTAGLWPQQAMQYQQP